MIPQLAREGGRDRVLYYAFHAVRDKMHRELTKLQHRECVDKGSKISTINTSSAGLLARVETERERERKNI